MEFPVAPVFVMFTAAIFPLFANQNVRDSYSYQCASPIRQMRKLVAEKFGDGFRASGMFKLFNRSLGKVRRNCANRKQGIEFVQIHDLLRCHV